MWVSSACGEPNFFLLTVVINLLPGATLPTNPRRSTTMTRSQLDSFAHPPLLLGRGFSLWTKKDQSLRLHKITAKKKHTFCLIDDASLSSYDVFFPSWTSGRRITLLPSGGEWNSDLDCHWNISRIKWCLLVWLMLLVFSSPFKLFYVSCLTN